MESLLTGVLSKLGEQGIEKIAGGAGVDPELAKKILSQAGPLLTGKMAQNAETAEGRASLETALENHDGSVFDRVDDVVNPEIDTKGPKILEHILGNKEVLGKLSEVLGSQNGIKSEDVTKILEMGAPLILGQLGAQKKDLGLDSGGLFDLLKSEKEKMEGDSFLMGIAKNFLDANKDGSIVDDVLGMAGKLLGK